MFGKISKIIPSYSKIIKYNPPNLNINDLPIELIVKIFEELEECYQEKQLSLVCRLFNSCIERVFIKKLSIENLNFFTVFEQSLINHNIILIIKLINHSMMKNTTSETKMLKMLVDHGGLLILKRLIDENLLDNKLWSEEVCYQALKKSACSGQLELTNYLLEKYFLEFQETWTDEEGEIFFKVIQQKQNEVAKLFFENKKVNPLSNQGASFLKVCREGNLDLLAMFLQASSLDLSPYLDAAVLDAVWYNQQSVLVELLKHKYFKVQPIKCWTLEQAHKRANLLNHYSIIKCLPPFKNLC